jgi:hypothetical protein
VPLTRPASEFQLTRSWILKLLDTVVRSDAAEELQRRQFSRRMHIYLSSMCIPTAGSGDTNTFFTIGHSTRTIVELADLLHESGVDLVIDVRSIPRSRTNPQFNQQSLPEALAPWQIGYEHIAELGGLRGKARGAEPSPNTYWRVRSFRNYADYALTAPFTAGLARLRERGSEHRCVIMCAEAVWWRCHRRIIADYLLAADEQVMHILGKSHVDVASLTPGAVIRNDGTVVYRADAELLRPEPDQS